MSPRRPEGLYWRCQALICPDAKDGPPKAAAIYTRISSDPEGSALGVSRQRDDCVRLADDLGWAVAEVYEDNDTSAYSRKPRPAYERMLEDFRQRHRDALLAYHPDRLMRQPRELEPFVDLMEALKVSDVRFVSGGAVGLDGDGLTFLRIQIILGAKESADKSRRVKRKLLQNAEAGLPHGGYHRPFGYAADKVTVMPAKQR